MMRNDKLRPRHRSTANVTGAVRLLPGNSLYQKQLTAPADPSVRAAAGTFAVSTGVAAGSVWCRLSPRSFTGHRNCPGSPLATPPALPAIQTRCCADRHPVWVVTQVPMSRRAPQHRRPVRRGAAPKGREAGSPSHPFARPARPYSASIAEIHREWRCKMILKEPYARAV